MLDLCLESTSSLEKIKQKNHASNIISPSEKKSVAPSEKVAPSERDEKGSGTLEDIKEPVVMICRKDLDNKIEKDNTNKYHFQGQSARSMHWFDLDHEWLEEMFCTREPDFYTNIYKMNTEGQEMEHIKYF